MGKQLQNIKKVQMSDKLKEESVNDFVYSVDGELFSDYDYVVSELEVYEPGIFTVWRGESREINHLDFINGDSIIESIQDSCLDEHGEYAEHYLAELKDNEVPELEQLISEWLIKKTGNPKFFGVHNLKKVKINTER
jgi:hypothetical protein